MSGERDLSGAWRGIFGYPHSLPPADFLATIVDHGASFSGETEECDEAGRALTGLFQGHRAGSTISFIKTYDNRHAYPIHYAGTLDADGNEISGSWRIEGQWSGTFVMIRDSRKGAQAQRTLAETVNR